MHDTCAHDDDHDDKNEIKTLKNLKERVNNIKDKTVLMIFIMVYGIRE